MSNKYWSILLLISVLVITRPASAQGSASKVSTTNSYDGLITEWETAQFSSGANSQRSTSYTTLFFIKDHLGSIRAVTDAQGHILERNAYYPFGLQTNQNLAFPTITTSLATLYPNYITSLPARRDLYNGKEIQTAAGTDYLDYGFRQYDPTAARWFNIDPMAEKQPVLLIIQISVFLRVSIQWWHQKIMLNGANQRLGKKSHIEVLEFTMVGKMLSRGQMAGLLFLPTTSPNTMELLIQSRSLRRPLRILIDYWERAHYLMNMNILIQKQGE